MKHFFLFLFIFLTISADAQTITTFAGNGTGWFNGDSIPALDAGISPECVAVDDSGNFYFTDPNNYRVRKVNKLGVIATIAGNGTNGFSGDSGLAINAQLNYPTGIAVDQNGNVYICDTYNERIRKISIDGIITTIAGTGVGADSGDNGPAIAASLGGPYGITIDHSSNIYIVNLGTYRVRKINTSGIITTIAGTGTHGYNGDSIAATTAELNYPRGIAVDGSGNVYIADAVNHRVRKVDTAGIITTFAGNGTGGYSGDDSAAAAAKLYAPYSIAIDVMGNIYISDIIANSVVRKVNTLGIITTYAGNGIPGFFGDNGPAIDAQLNGPKSIALDNAGNMYIADAQNFRIRFIKSILLVNTPSASIVATIYPNPTTTGQFTINISGKVDEKAKIIIIDMLGNIIKEVDTVTGKPIDISVNAPSGIYSVIIATAGQVLSKKICVLK